MAYARETTMKLKVNVPPPPQPNYVSYPQMVENEGIYTPRGGSSWRFISINNVALAIKPNGEISKANEEEWKYEHFLKLNETIEINFIPTN